MSTYDDSSLFLYPSGYKASVLFAQKPMDANGQLAFTRSNDTATRVASNGLIEKVRTNLATYSEQFNNAAWSKQEITVTANAAVAPDGTQSADKLIPTAVTSTHQITSATLTTLTQCAFSVFAKADGYNTITILDLSVASNGATFNVATGTVSTISGTATASIVPYGNGWYRCIVVANTTGVRFYVPTSASNFTGDGTSGVLLWGAQVEAGDIATDYIATTTAAVSVGPLANIPRIDYLGGGCGKLLLEPQRTNLATQSENFNGWSFKVNVTTTANYEVSPDGYTNADRLQFTGAGFMYGATGFVQTSGTTYTLSCYAKRNGSGTQSVGFFVNGSGVVNSAWTLTSEWQRFTYTYTASNNSSVGIAGANGADVSVYGFQFEAGAYATSYIPTLAASVTRGADSCSKTGISSLIGQTEGTLFAEFVWTKVGKIYQSFLLGGTTNYNNTVYLLTTESSGSASYQLRIGGTTAIATINTTFTTGTRYKIALAYKSGSIAFYVNGVSVGTSSATYGAVSEAISQFRYDWPYGGDEQWCSPISQTLLFKTRLPNSELAALTAL